MRLDFRKGMEGYGAITGAWPSQRRAVIYKSGNDWRLSFRQHILNVGFVEYENTTHKTVREAKETAEQRFT